MVLEAPSIKAKPTVTWEPLPANFILPDDPVENTQQPSLAAALTDALGAAGCIQPEMLIASNLGLVATVNKNIVVKAPDWFYVPQVHPLADGVIRRSYTPHTDGANVAIVMEFLSEAEEENYRSEQLRPMVNSTFTNRFFTYLLMSLMTPTKVF